MHMQGRVLGWRQRCCRCQGNGVLLHDMGWASTRLALPVGPTCGRGQGKKAAAGSALSSVESGSKKVKSEEGISRLCCAGQCVTGLQGLGHIPVAAFQEWRASPEGAPCWLGSKGPCGSSLCHRKMHCMRCASCQCWPDRQLVTQCLSGCRLRSRDEGPCVPNLGLAALPGPSLGTPRVACRKVCPLWHARRQQSSAAADATQ